MDKVTLEMLFLVAPGSEHYKAFVNDSELLSYSYKRFPDGESYFRLSPDALDRVQDRAVTVISTLFPEQNKRLVELQFLGHLLRSAGAKHVHAIVPYLAYARADRKVLDGELVAQDAVLENMILAIFDKIYVLHIHNPDAFKAATNERGINIDAGALMTSSDLASELEGAIVVSPDAGQFELAKQIAASLKGRASHFSKTRDPLTGSVTTDAVDLQCSGKDILIVDDIVSSGRSLLNAVELVKEQNPSSISVFAVHGLFVGDPEGSLLKRHGVNRIITTDSIKSQFSSIHCIPTMIERVKQDN